MKFVYFGYDFMLPCVFRLLEDGHELAGIMSFECDNVFNFNQACQKLAEARGVPFIMSPAGDAHIAGFEDEGAELFISAGYAHKIPQNNEEKSRAINIHPTYLPKGRGIMPLPHIIMNGVDAAAGFSAHKMTQSFDAGDILKQFKFDLAADETVESYTAKVAIAAPDFVSDLASNLDQYWGQAQAQDAADVTHYSAPSDEDRMMKWESSVHEIDAVARAFGRFGSIAPFDGRLWVVYDHQVWEEDHGLPPGHIAAMTSREIVIASRDGFVLLKSFEEARIPEV